MKNENYAPAKDSHGKEYLCPVDTVGDLENIDRDAHNCVEKDVTERYSGNYSVKSE